MWLPMRGGEAIASLVAIHMGGLRKVEVGAVGEVWKQKLVGEIELRVGVGFVLREGRDVVVEVVVVGAEVVGHVAADDARPCGYGRVEAVQRILALGGSGVGRGLRGRGLRRVRGMVVAVAQAEGVVRV